MTTRRQLLAAAAALPALVAPAHAGASFTCLPAGDASAWDAAVARYEAIAAEDRHFHDAIYHPVMDPIHEMSPPYRFQHVARNGHAVSYCVDGPDLCKYDTERFGLWVSMHNELSEAKATYATYLDARSKVDVDGLNERSDAYGSALFEAERELLAMPAPHLAALEWKVELLVRQSDDSAIQPAELAQILSDVRRLDGRADL